MRRWRIVGAAVALTWFTWAGAAGAVIVPFTEPFAADTAGWEDNIDNPLTFVPAGGPDGSGYVSGSFDYTGFEPPPQAPDAGPIVFRGNDSDDASGDAFVGDWVADGVAELSAFVRHDAPVSLTYVARLAWSQNFPAVALDPPDNVVPPNTWTEIVFQVPGSFCIPETFGMETCEELLMSIARVQFGVNAPEALIEDEATVTFDLDDVTVVPEPGERLTRLAGLLGVGVLVAWRRLRGSA